MVSSTATNIEDDAHLHAHPLFRPLTFGDIPDISSHAGSGFVMSGLRDCRWYHNGGDGRKRREYTSPDDAKSHVHQ